MSSNGRRLEFIDALRGYAILGVILVHSSMSVAPVTAALVELTMRGALGVQLFYIASALTLSLSWQARKTTELRPLRNFYLRRFFRIAPLFYLAICLYLLLYGFAARYWAPEGVAWWQVPLTAVFLNGFFPETINSIVPGGWSIAVETSFYVIFPFIMLWITSLRAALFACAMSLVVFEASKIAVWRIFPSHYPTDQQYLVTAFASLNVFAQMPAFAAGIVASFLLARVAALKNFLLLSNGTLVAMFLFTEIMPTRFTSMISHSFVGIIFLFGALTLNLAVFPFRLLVNPFIGFLGKISYSMYLTHFAILYFLSWAGAPGAFKVGNWAFIVYFCTVTLMTALVSTMSFRWIEKPGISVGNQIVAALERAQLDRQVNQHG